MSELDEFWSEQLAAATQNARAAGRADIADYLTLKAENDAIRSAEVERLFSGLIAAAMSDRYRSKPIKIEREAPHNFHHRKANLVGSLLRMRYGVRCMTVEAGWTRTPSDGFMRLKALAFARITHFGLPKGSMELALVNADGNRIWRIVQDETASVHFDIDFYDQHISLLVGD